MTAVLPAPARTDKVPPRGLVFTYALEEPVSLSQPTHRHLERWVVTVTNGDRERTDSGITIGDAQVLIVNLEAGQDVRAFADTASGEWREQTEGGPGSSHVLVLERVWVDPAYRGHGLGPIIAATVVDRLGRGCHLAACYPAPFAGDCRPEDREQEIEALGRIWAKVGFQPWRDGVWMLDLEERRTQPVP
ncbi:MAG: GNAT family N-acetyltransferase [Acidimicrobiales bacterium]